jgi:serine/threonine-protein kinase
LLPVSKNAIEGAILVGDLAQIYVMVTEYDSAIERLEYLFSIPSYTSVQLLRADPLYDPLRDHPRFQTLLED